MGHTRNANPTTTHTTTTSGPTTTTTNTTPTTTTAQRSTPPGPNPPCTNSTSEWDGSNRALHPHTPPTARGHPCRISHPPPYQEQHPYPPGHHVHAEGAPQAQPRQGQSLDPYHQPLPPPHPYVADPWTTGDLPPPPPVPGGTTRSPPGPAGVS